MADRVIVLSARYVDFVDQKTGELVQGTKVRYFYPDLEMEEGSVGISLIDEWVREKNLIPLLQVCPAVYQICMKRVPGRGGKPTERIDSFSLVTDLRPAFKDFAILCIPPDR